MSAVRVVHIITKLELGGAQQNTLFTVAHLNPARFRPLLVAGPGGLLDPEARALPGVRFLPEPSLVRPIRPLLDVRAVRRLTARLRQVRPLIVHTHSSKAGILGRWAAWFAGVPIIIHSIHGFGFTRYQHPAIRFGLVTLERLTARITSRFFAVSEANRALGVTLGLFPAARCSVVRSGIDLETWRRVQVDVGTKRRQLGLQPEAPVIGMVGALKPQKAPLDFVRMAAWVSRDRPDAQFLLVGGGELRPAVEAEVTRLGLSHRFVLTGWRHDIPEILRCLDVFVLTSLWEGLPRVYLEALVSGVPVVGTEVDGAAEVVRDGVNGFLVQPGDPNAMAERVVLLLNRPDLRLRMGRTGMNLSDEFDIRQMVRQQEAEYERLLLDVASKRHVGSRHAYAAEGKR